MTLRRADESFTLDSSNISAGGIKLSFVRAGGVPGLAAGELVELEFHLPLLSSPIIVAGEIRWIGPDTCGVQFRSLSPRVVSAINRLHSRLPPS